MGVMLSAALTLTNCTAEMDQPAEAPSAEGTFEIIANTADTRTVNDGMSTKWEAGDTINVFHAVAGSEDYVNDGEFEIAEADLENGRFTGNLSGTLEADGTYDWYAFFPYTRQKTSPADAQTGYAYIGHSKGLNQTGYDNMSALRRTVCPLYGVAKAVAGDDVPGITMQHLSSVIAVEVTNGTEAPLTVTSVSFTAPEPIVGTFYMAFADGEPVYIPSGDSYVNSTAVVNVKEGTALAKGETATVYIAVKPFTAAEDDDLTLIVNGYEKYLTMTKDVTFHAGKIKTLKFKYDYVPTGNIATFDFNANEWGLPVSVDEKGKQGDGNIVEPLTSGDVTMTAYNSAENSNKIRMWQGTSKTDLRAYNGSSLAFSVPQGYVITKMTFNADEMPDASVSTPSGTFKSSVWTGKSNPVVYNFTKTIKINTIIVEYEAGTGDSPELPEVEEPDPEPEPEPDPDPEPEDPDLVPGPHTSNLMWTAESDAKSYSHKVIVEGTEYDALKLGTGSATGTSTITIPAGTVKVGFYGVAWKGKKGTITVSSAAARAVLYTKELVSNDGATNNSPYTISVGNGDYYEINVASILGAAPTSDIEVTVSTVDGAYRAIIWGLNYYTSSGLGDSQWTEPEPEPEPEPELPGDDESDADVVINFITQRYENAQEVSGLTVDGVTVTLDKGTNSNTPKWYDSGNAVRVYGGGTFTVSSATTIESIKLYYGGSDGTNEITVNTGTFETNTWTGSSKEVIFTVGGEKGHRRIQKIEVYYN